MPNKLDQADQRSEDIRREAEGHYESQMKRLATDYLGDVYESLYQLSQDDPLGVDIALACERIHNIKTSAADRRSDFVMLGAFIYDRISRDRYNSCLQSAEQSVRE